MKRHAIRLAGCAVACAAVVLPLILKVPTTTKAVTSQVTLRPTSDVSNSQWTHAGTVDNSCAPVGSFCDYVDETTTDGDTSYINAAAGQAPTITFGMGGSGSGQTATSIEVHAVSRAGANGGLGYRTLDIALTIGGVTQATQSVTPNSTTYQDLSVTFTGTWTKSDVDNATITLSKTANGLQPAIRVTTLYAYVNYVSPVQDQNAVRLYANANSVSPGAPLAATNTVGETTASAPFRLRAGLTVGDTTWQTGSWGPHNNQYKLQYALKNAGTCSGTTGWSDVTSGSGAIRWYDNTSVSDGASIASIGANDPTTSGTKVYQAYRESNPFTLSSNTAVGNTALWDFSLQSVGTTPGTSYCFRVIQNDGTALNAYSAYPEALMVGSYDVSIVDASGNTVTSPVVNFPATSVTTKTCNTSGGGLGTPLERIRVTNDVLTNGWTLSLAPTAGPTATWTSGVYGYDFNDPTGSGCSDGADGDARAGQLTVSAFSATVTPKSGCSSTGLATGGSGSFSEGVTNSLTLYSANGVAQRFCYWDITNISLVQKIPAAIPAGNYSLDMTITMTAL